MGKYEFIRLPFGMRNALFEFQRVIYDLLGDLPYVFCYVDDITIGSNSFDEHIEHVKIVLKRLESAGLKLFSIYFARSLKLILTNNGNSHGSAHLIITVRTSLLLLG